MHAQAAEKFVNAALGDEHIHIASVASQFYELGD